MILRINPTFIGLFAVLVWGVGLPVIRLIEAQVGVPGVIGAVFAGAGVFGLIKQRLLHEPLPNKVIFRNPYLYGRWVFFVLHEALILTAISIVQKQYVPFVILLNYLWPTAIIFSCISLAGMKVARWGIFIMGSMIVLTSLSIEILGSGGISSAMFSNSTDVLAYILAFVGAVSWGLYCALSRRAGDATGGSSVLPFFQLTLGLALPVSLLPGISMWSNLTADLLLLLCIICIVQFIAYLCWDSGMRRGNVVILSLCADFIPWISLLTSYLVLGTEIGNRTTASAICLVIGAMITRYSTLQKSPDLAKEELPGV